MKQRIHLLQNLLPTTIFSLVSNPLMSQLLSTYFLLFLFFGRSIGQYLTVAQMLPKGIRFPVRCLNHSSKTAMNIFFNTIFMLKKKCTRFYFIIRIVFITAGNILLVIPPFQNYDLFDFHTLFFSHAQTAVHMQSICPEGSPLPPCSSSSKCVHADINTCPWIAWAHLSKISHHIDLFSLLFFSFTNDLTI